MVRGWLASLRVTKHIHPLVRNDVERGAEPLFYSVSPVLCGPRPFWGQQQSERRSRVKEAGSIPVRTTMRKSNIQKIEDKLKQDGYVDNFWCIDNKITTRLGAVIFVLKERGYEFDEAQSGFVRGTKNWRYYLVGGPVPIPAKLVPVMGPNGVRMVPEEVVAHLGLTRID